MVNDGRTGVLLNEFYKKTTFYKTWDVENFIREIAKKYRNSYSVALFACCREIMNRNKHCGGYSKEQKENEIQLENDKERYDKMMKLVGTGIQRQFKEELDLARHKLAALQHDHEEMIEAE